MADRVEYNSIPSSEPNIETEAQNFDYIDKPPSFQKRVCSSRILLLGLSSGFLLATAIFIVISRGYYTKDASIKPSSCTTPIIRREWRTLTKEEKHEYFRAVKCLNTKASKLGTGYSLYNDFTHIHQGTGYEIHGEAGFLAWHRYFIHVYETALKEECQYTGHLVYWNWELDWEDITKAPVWGSEEGFGSNGQGEPSIPDGKCVIDGPFANMSLYYFNTTKQEHCLSREFRQPDTVTGQISGSLSPDTLQKIFDHQDYMSFNLALEDGAHLAIPLIIRGDFFYFTAPNDPVFYLHHTQLDRLWWKWQQIDPQTRLRSYNGKVGAPKEASVDDILDMKDLAPAIAVSGIMSTNSELLCYIY